MGIGVFLADPSNIKIVQKIVDLVKMRFLDAFCFINFKEKHKKFLINKKY